MTKHTWYYLDADNNKPEPKGLYCERCKRPLKETQSFENFISIILHPENPWFRRASATELVPSHLSGLIGEKCFERVKEEYGIMQS